MIFLDPRSVPIEDLAVPDLWSPELPDPDFEASIALRRSVIALSPEGVFLPTSIHSSELYVLSQAAAVLLFAPKAGPRSEAEDVALLGSYGIRARNSDGMATLDVLHDALCRHEPCTYCRRTVMCHWWDESGKELHSASLRDLCTVGHWAREASRDLYLTGEALGAVDGDHVSLMGSAEEALADPSRARFLAAKDQDINDLPVGPLVRLLRDTGALPEGCRAVLTGPFAEVDSVRLSGPSGEAVALEQMGIRPLECVAQDTVDRRKGLRVTCSLGKVNGNVKRVVRDGVARGTGTAAERACCGRVRFTGPEGRPVPPRGVPEAAFRIACCDRVPWPDGLPGRLGETVSELSRAAEDVVACEGIDASSVVGSLFPDTKRAMDALTVAEGAWSRLRDGPVLMVPCDGADQWVAEGVSFGEAAGVGAIIDAVEAGVALEDAFAR